MEVIKQSIQDKQETEYFRCDCCSCEFKADSTKYKKVLLSWYTFLQAECPKCRVTVYKVL